MSRDPHSVAGKPLHVDETAQLLVIGAGPAGLGAALEGAALGLHVVLVDENPIATETMGIDVPMHFGGRVGGAARNRGAMMEAVLDSDPAIAAAFEAGVDVRLGTVAWGLYANNRSVRWLPGLVAGLIVDGRSTTMLADRVVVAAGRRDMGLAFPGWELPGVMGIAAACRLAVTYGALDVRRAVVLGSTAETSVACSTLQRAGVDIAAVIEQAAEPVAAFTGPEMLTGHCVRRALGGPDGVCAVVAGPVDAQGQQTPGPERTIACDAVLLGVGAVPAIELLDALGCEVTFQADRGGFALVLDADGLTSVPGVYAAGDCAGVWGEKAGTPGIAREEGARAARAAGVSLGVATAALAEAPPSPPSQPGLAGYRTAWVRAAVIQAAGEPHVCQCEEVTARDILDVRPPRYLGWPEDRRNQRNLAELLGASPPHPDQIKRLTRAGMGVCQGRRCREQVACLLALGADLPLEAIAPASYRAPVRPIPLAAAADGAERSELTAQWDTWFGMHSQYLPPWEVPAGYTAAGRDLDGEVASE